MAVDVIDPVLVARELFPNQQDGFPFEIEDFSAIQLPEDDDVGIASEDDVIEEEEIQADTGFGSVIVVDNLPKVNQEKYDKLCAVIKKIFSAVGKLREGGLQMPVDPATNDSKGFAFLEFNNPEEAHAAREQFHNYALGKANILIVNMFDDFDKYARVPDEYQLPEVKEFQDQDDMYSWMTDKQSRDQFIMRYGDETAVLWNDGKRGRSEEAYKRTYWTESFVQWSPRGSMLATIHRQGVAVWGGPAFTRLARFSHPGVSLIEFSPNESYLLSYSSAPPLNPRGKVQATFNIFDSRIGKKLRSFEGDLDDFAVRSTTAAGTLRWPVFKWAGGKEDLYLARLGRNLISIYAAPDMVLLDKTSVKLEGVQEFEWSPAEPVLAAYITEQGNLPARITLIKIPERTEIRQKNLFSVKEVRMFWHPEGEYLAVVVERYTKTKKSSYTGFELFSTKERDIPMEVLELATKSDKVAAFAWEPKGNRFAVVHGEEKSKLNISFYSMRDEKGRLGARHLGTLSSKTCNQLFWSPQGKNIVLAGLKGLGQLEFFNVDEFEILAAVEHYMANDVEWDPTGRYVTSSVTNIEHMENGFNVWSFNGRLLYSVTKDRFYQFCWRPRMPSLLPPEKEAEITKNLKQYSKKYEEEDEALLMQADADVLQERQRVLDEWRTWLDSKRELIEEVEDFKREIYGPRYGERDFTMQTVTVEQILETKEEPYI